MSLPNEALQKLVQEIETQAIQAQKQIAVARTQMAGKQREMRMTQLMQRELASLPADTPVYEGLGKMFVAESIPALRGKLGTQVRALEGDVDGLGKRLQYLETTAKNSQEHISQILQRTSGQ